MCKDKRTHDAKESCHKLPKSENDISIRPKKLDYFVELVVILLLTNVIFVIIR